MSAENADFAVFGSTPLARLVAGLLASRHGKKVVVIGEVKARFRLPRVADLSLAAITRPQTWALLQANVPETTRLIGKIGGRGAHRHVDPIFFAESEAAREALGHVSNMARAFGLVVESLSAKRLGPNRFALRIGDAVALNRSVLEPALETWLAACGVQILPTAVAAFAGDGSVTLRQGDVEIVASHALLADDAAVEDHLPRHLKPASLIDRVQSTILTASGQHLASPVMMHLDSSTWLVEHEEGGMAAIGPGQLAGLSQNLVTLLNQPTQLQQVGQVSFRTLAMRDNAPLIARDLATGRSILVGLNGWGSFLAPALARWLSGEATRAETRWISAHDAQRTIPVAEIGALADGFVA